MAFVVKVTWVLAVAGAMVLAACDGSENTGATGTMAQASTASTTMKGPSCAGGLTAVSAQANIFGAGSEFAPGPGGGGGGALPPSVQLPEGASVVTFPTVTGKVTALMGSLGYHGPRGDRKGATNITSYGGISGILNRRAGLFLVAVFLTDEPPSSSAPNRLDFTKREGFRTLAPDIGQTFLVGDGKDRTFHVPPGATRLFLGFADAYSLGEGALKGNYQGRPGYYDNNGGHLCVGVGTQPE